MPSGDDRAEFEEAKRRHASEMSADASLVSRARELLTEADRHGWSYQWTWLGLPIIQLPTDVLAIQEVVWTTRPDLIIETGVARGGSLLLYASLFELMGRGEVIGIDVDIRAHNRGAIEAHPLGTRVRLIEGSSVSADVVDAVRRLAIEATSVMVVLDSDHTHEHVLRELELYAPFVTAGQYLVVCDTVVEDLPVQAHRPREWGPGNNPATALREFLSGTDAFEVDQELSDKVLMTSSPGGYLRRVALDSAP